jgi:class 3 adenylate cyclase
MLAEFASPRRRSLRDRDPTALERANQDEPEGCRMRFRIGVDVGDVMVKNDDLFGDGVNLAARLEGLVKAARSASRGACMITCVTATALSLKIWASSWSRTGAGMASARRQLR